MQPEIALPPLPPVGQPEEYYVRRIRDADRHGDVHGHESLKVAQYITLALGVRLAWPEKQRYFEHAIHRHCTPPLDSTDEVIAFYNQLKELVRNYAGEEAIRVASKADDQFAARERQGDPPADIRRDADLLFRSILGDAHRTPDYFIFDDWHQIVVLKNAWAGGDGN
jgi:hypothetical protein